MDVKRLNTWERKRLKRVYGPVAEQGMWITRTNQELREVHIDVDIVAYIKKMCGLTCSKNKSWK
jgi:hypothetical protein